MMGRGLRVRQDSQQPQCGSNDLQTDYNLPLHVGALFIILTVSASACAFPLMVTRFPSFKINHKFLFAVRHFGTGVLLATAFVHLLPTAFINLTNPCLPAFWNDDYPAMAGAIALLSVFLITTIEMIFSPGAHCCQPVENVVNQHGMRKTLADQTVEKAGNEGSQEATQVGGSDTTSFACTNDMARGPLYGRSISGRSQSNGRRFSEIALPNRNETDTIEPPSPIPESTDRRISIMSMETLADKSATEQRQKALMQCVMLEVGILFHSVFIGMALAVAVGRNQIILLIAIVFHQSFEGLALGSRIAAVGWKKRALQPWLMALAYGCTTPLGQAIGIATRNLYSPDSQTGLLVVGIMNAISSGLLTFNSLIDLLSEDFLSDQSWKNLRGNKRIIAFSLVFFGAFCMALIGAWA